MTVAAVALPPPVPPVDGGLASHIVMPTSVSSRAKNAKEWASVRSMPCSDAVLPVLLRCCGMLRDRAAGTVLHSRLPSLVEPPRTRTASPVQGMQHGAQACILATAAPLSSAAALPGA
jgi:hypothetical protein